MEKQQNVVFFIGAGFSVPFGLPIMSNFIDKDKDLFFYDRVKFEQIGKTLELIQEYSFVKNYMTVNLHNIEDLLSIGYMESILNTNKVLLSNITTFIKTVITAYTNDTTNSLLWFARLVANNSFEDGNSSRQSYRNKMAVEYRSKKYVGKIDNNSSYGIISLNYDLLIENALTKIADELGGYYQLGNEKNILLDYYMPIKKKGEIGIPFAKLHGSIDGTIIPPTWNKTVSKEIKEDWKLANILLSEATHIIFLGYSLPSTDNYIKYLLASSLNINKRLKKISVITLDNDGNTKKRYDNLFNSRLVFHNANINNFFMTITHGESGIDFDQYDEYLMEYYKK